MIRIVSHCHGGQPPSSISKLENQEGHRYNSAQSKDLGKGVGVGEPSGISPDLSLKAQGPGVPKSENR